MKISDHDPSIDREHPELDKIEQDSHDEVNALEPIAIIAMTGRFPGAKDVEQFWENLRNGVESVTFFSDGDLTDSGIEPSILKDPKFIRADAVLEDIDLFDAEFFNYNPREAEIMDPQHRLFLECAWEVMELAGYNPEALEDRVGVYAGANLSSYLLRNLVRNRKFVASVGSFQTMLGNSQDFLATKVSYKLDLKGPSVNTNTLCSSSMVGVHFACQALWNYQIDMGLAGGVSVQVSRNEAMFYQEGGIGSFDGHCRAFDDGARGTVSGSGLGVVVLKRLEDALRDGDMIHALIRGSAINNDGGKKMSYTAPSVEGQAEVIAEAMAVGGIHPDSISYLEAHGTGTSLGDPIEILGLTKAYREQTDRNQYCAIGSVKTNIGHLVTAGGVASLIKTVKAMNHKVIPPSLNFEKPNAKIDFENSPFYVANQLMEWVSDGPRRAGVSSFGIGGTNSHVIVEEAAEAESSHYHRQQQLLLLSARSQNALERAKTNLLEHLETHPEISMDDVAFTLQVGRKAFPHRYAFTCHNLQEGINLLKVSGKQPTSAYREVQDRKVAFLFPGQGSQYPGMTRGLYQSEPIFRERIDTCCRILEPVLGFDLKKVLYPDSDETDAAAERLKSTDVTQPALFVVEYALARLWMGWGIQPSAFIGHSIGEYVAACLAGVFSLEDGLGLVAARGAMIARLPPGEMLAVALAEDVLKSCLPAELTLASINAPGRCVVSGERDAVLAFAETLREDVETTLLHTSHAFHSQMMKPIVDEYTEYVRGVQLNPPEIPFISNVTGDWIIPEQATDPAYYAEHLCRTVRFENGLQLLFSEQEQVLLEVGPGQTLSSLARQNPVRDKAQLVLNSVKHPKALGSDEELLLNALAQLWLAGVPVDWNAYHEHERPRRIQLPTYPFERRRYWIEPDMTFSPVTGDVAIPNVAGSEYSSSDLHQWCFIPTWQKTQPLARVNDIADRRYWLLFLDQYGLGRQLARTLIDEGQRVITVNAGEAFAKQDTDIYTVRPGDVESYAHLLEDLRNWHRIPQKIVSFWCVDEAPRSQDWSKRFNHAQNRGLYHLLSLIKALASEDHDEEVDIAIVGSKMTEISAPKPHAEKAAILGPLRVIPQEHPNISCRCIDVEIPPEENRHQTGMVVGVLLSELTAWPGDTLVAYKGHGRWVKNFERVLLPKTQQSLLKTGGVYLITGSLNPSGEMFAEFLARTLQAKLVLVDTVDPSDRRDGPDKLEKAKTDDVKAKLEALGGEVLFLQANFSDPIHWESVLSDACSRFGTLHGVIHAASFTTGQVLRPIEETDRGWWEAQFLQKLTDLVNLERVLEGRELDFVLLVSSMSSVLGGLGLAGHAAANSFADAFALAHNQDHPVAWISLNWDGWEPDGQERTANANAMLASAAVDPTDVMRAFHRAIDHGGLDQIALYRGDLRERLRWIFRQHEEEPTEEYATHPRPNLQNAYVAPTNEVERKVAGIWQKRMGIERVGLHDNFFDLGGDSLLVVKIRRGLQEEFGMNFLTSDLFEHPTVAAIAEYIDLEKEEMDFGDINDRAVRQKMAMEEEVMFQQARNRAALHLMPED